MFGGKVDLKDASLKAENGAVLGQRERESGFAEQRRYFTVSWQAEVFTTLLQCDKMQIA